MISPEFWDDDVVRSMDPEEKLAFLWLLTNSKRSILGVTEISERKFTEETGISAEALRRALARHKGLRRASTCVWVRAWIKWQFGRGRLLVRNNICSSILKALEELQIDELVDEILEEYPELQKPYMDWRACVGLKALRSPPKGSREYESPPKGKEKEKEKEKVQGVQGDEIPTKAEWDAACDVGGVPRHVGDYEWLSLGERGFRVGADEVLTRSRLHFRIAKIRTWWQDRGCPTTWPAPNGGPASRPAMGGRDDLRDARAMLHAELTSRTHPPTDARRGEIEGEIQRITKALEAA